MKTRLFLLATLILLAEIALLAHARARVSIDTPQSELSDALGAWLCLGYVLKNVIKSATLIA